MQCLHATTELQWLQKSQKTVLCVCWYLLVWLKSCIWNWLLLKNVYTSIFISVYLNLYTSMLMYTVWPQLYVCAMKASLRWEGKRLCWEFKRAVGYHYFFKLSSKYINVTRSNALLQHRKNYSHLIIMCINQPIRFNYSVIEGAVLAHRCKY